MRHRAWLAATPKKASRSRLEEFTKRREDGRHTPQLVMPPLDGYRHLIDHLFRVGPATGGEPLTYQEVEAYLRLTGYRLHGWECETLRMLSAAWVTEYRAADDPHRQPPFAPTITSTDKIDRAAVAAQLERMFASLERENTKAGASRPIPAHRRIAPPSPRGSSGRVRSPQG